MIELYAKGGTINVDASKGKHYCNAEVLFYGTPNANPTSFFTDDEWAALIVSAKVMYDSRAS